MSEGKGYIPGQIIEELGTTLMNLTQRRTLKALKSLAPKIPLEQGRVLTGLIGELSTCHLLNLRWAPSNGYDAVDRKGKQVQIKTRRDSKGGKVDGRGTTGKFTNFNFDYALYAELDANFGVTAVFKLEKKVVRQWVRPRRNDVSVNKIRKYGEQVFPKNGFTQ